jgi:hypothetical protein
LNECESIVRLPAEEETRNASHAGPTARRKHNMLKSWKSRAAAFAVAATMGAVPVLGMARPAGAIIRFCTDTVCIGSGNGCSTTTTKGVVILADDGDSFIAADGTKWTCNHGKWVKTSTALIQSVRGPVLGRGEFFQGPPPANPCDLSPDFQNVIAACETIIL